MGRKPTNPGAVPRLRLRKRGAVTYYFYDHGVIDGKRREEPLGRDRGEALTKWAAIERESVAPPSAAVTFRDVADAYRVKVIPTKAPRTQQDNARELAKLLEFFDDPPCPFNGIEPGDVQDYMNWRSAAPIRATREKALLSHIWNWARANRYTSKPNPCAGIKGETAGRDAYVEDAVFLAIWEKGSEVLRDAMDLAYLTGQRPGDVVRASEGDIRGGVLHFQQGKTGAKVRVEVTGPLAAVIERIRQRKAGMKQACDRLVVNASGQPIGVNALSRYWKAACEAAKVEGYQFRDLRAKAATDKEQNTGNIRQSQALLGHASVRMTEAYTRNRQGLKVEPTR